jgi:sulfate adenylyltransferase subunit 2
VQVDSILDELESEAIEIIRETVGAFKKPVLLYSIGKDSSVLLHLVKKAFFPSKIPFPMLHIDTTWKFKEMIKFRDKTAQEMDMELLINSNADAIKAGINPFTTGISEYTRIMKTVPLREAIDIYGFDAAIGGSRRDEEKSRAKERIFSVREKGHVWNPKNQRPEIWHHYNTKLKPDQSMRVFPISNWTELDVWLYIRREDIVISQLYFAKPRKVVLRDKQFIMVDDDRFPLLPKEYPVEKNIRFRTLGCYPLSAGIESSADSIDQIILEIRKTKLSERSTRLIDNEQEDSMELKKSEGYF